MTPLAADQALAAYFLEARSKILDLAAILDRVQRGDGAAQTAADPRLERIARSLQILSADARGKAEAVQRVFSLDYDSGWKIPEPR
jgi:hypothetical protein